MIKTFKNAISLILVIAFVLSLVPVVSFAEYEYTYTGVNDGTVVLAKESNVAGYQRMESVNENIGGKGDDDYYLLLADSDGAKRRIVELTNASGGQDVLEMSVYIPSGSNGISLNLYLTNTENKSKELPLLIRQDGIYTNFSGGPSRFYTLEPDKWHNLAFVTPEPYSASSAENDNKIKIYLNGNLINSRAVAETKSGFRNKIFIGSYGNGIDTPQAYLDNIRVHSNEYIPEYDVVDDIDYEGGIEGNTLLTRGDVTVAQLKDGITKKEDTTIRVYESVDSTQPLPDDALVKDGSMVVAAAKNGADMERSYNYYTTGKYIHKYPNINDGTTILTKSETSSSYADWYQMESVNENLGGKGDAYLLMADSSGVNRTIALTNASGEQDVFEMSFYVPSNSDGVSLTLYFTNLSNKSVSLPLLIKSDGLYTNWSSGPSRFHTLKPDRWYNFGFVTPKPYVDSAADNSNEVQMYINGELIDVRATTTTKSGFRNKIFTASINGDSSHKIKAYYDNIRAHSGTYDAEYDVLDKISYKDGIDADNNIIVKGATTVAQLKAGITKKEDTTIRVYRTFGSTEVLSDDTYVEDGYVVVAAAKNGSEMERSYNYYTVDKVKRYFDVNTLVNGAASKIYDDDDTISVSTDYINYDDEDHEVVMYTAAYKYGKLVKIWEDSQTVEVGESATFTCDFADLESRVGTNVKVMLWDNTSQTPYMATSTMHYNSENTKATLYLLGDSIVQTYVNENYPIQGWGYYLGDYLNDNIVVENRGRSGWTTDHYLYPDGVYTKENGLLPVGTELLNTKGTKKVVGESDRYRTWESIKSTLKSGDYIMIALGINDSGTGNVPEARYRENIETIYTEATAMGASVILMTPSITGRDWNDTAGFREDYAGKGNICKSIAASHGSVCLEYGAELIKTYNAMVEEYQAENPDATLVEAKNYVRNYFHLYGASSTNPPPGWDDFGSKTTDDKMHYNFVGAKKAASVIAKLLAESDSPLGDYVIK